MIHVLRSRGTTQQIDSLSLLLTYTRGYWWVAVNTTAIAKLCDWQNNIESIWNDDSKRDSMRREARNWSDKLLALSGLLYQEPNETKKVAEPKP